MEITTAAELVERATVDAEVAPLISTLQAMAEMIIDLTDRVALLEGNDDLAD